MARLAMLRWLLLDSAATLRSPGVGPSAQRILGGWSRAAGESGLGRWQSMRGMSARVPLPSPPDRQPDVTDDFSGTLSSDLWIEHYLPHWTTPDRSAVSNLQTGTFSGPARVDEGDASAS